MNYRTLVLQFPSALADEPTVCSLATDFNLTFKIVEAMVSPDQGGKMVIEVSGAKRDFSRAVRFLKDSQVQVHALDQELIRDVSMCTHCGACTGVCPTGALSILRPQMEIELDTKKCSVCGLCVPGCPYGAMEITNVDECIQTCAC